MNERKRKEKCGEKENEDGQDESTHTFKIRVVLTPLSAWYAAPFEPALQKMSVCHSWSSSHPSASQAHGMVAFLWSWHCLFLI